MATFPRIYTLALAAGLAVLPGLPAHADPLTDLDLSPEMARFESTKREDNLYGPRYMKADSNFAAVFIPGDGYMNLQNWISPSEEGFKGGPISGMRTPEYAEAQRNFTAPSGSEIKSRVLVPHPKFVSMLKFGLIKPFADLEAPALEYVNKESIDIRGTSADLYVTREKNCMLIMHLSRSAVLQLQQSECTGLNTLVTLAEALDLKRLERKLES
ncbi:MAG: hypothetical protein J0M12_00795 [Deltaproteobacteria bacterium]|nr:hypothetical protein [Deltaproteobacteria bacterium]